MKILILGLLLFTFNTEARNPVIMAYLDQAPAGCEITITSGHRTIEHNKKVGGAKNSLHLSDRAIDAVISCRSWVVKTAKDFGITIILYKKHIHLDIRTKCMVKLLKGGYRFCRTGDK